MSDPENPTDAEKPKKPKKPKNLGRWRRRILWSLVILVVLLFTLRALLPLMLPRVLKKVAGIYGLTCEYDRMELNLFSGDAGIWGLQFKPAEGGSPILATDYCSGNVSVLNLLKGKLNVWRVEADGVEVNIDRNPDGHIPLLDRFITATAKNPPVTVTSPSTTTTASSRPVDLASPVRVDALRLSHIRVHIHDRGIKPELDTDLAMDLRLSDLGSTTGPAKFEMNLSADPLLDSMKITGEGKSGGKNLDAKMNVLIRGIRLKPAAAYLAPFGIVPVSDGITLTAQGQVHTAAAPNNAEGFTGSVEFDHLSATADRQEAAALDHLSITAGVIDTRSIHFNSIMIDGARATAARNADGNLQLSGVEYNPLLVANSPPQASPASPATTPPVLLALLAERWTVGEIAVKHSSLNLHDEGANPPVDLSLLVDELAARSIDYDPANPNTRVTMTGTLHAPGLVRDIALEGSATPFAENKKFTIAVNAAGIKPDAVKPYLDPLGIESTLKNGQFSAAVDASLAFATDQTLTAGLNVSKFDFRDGGPLLALDGASMKDLVIDPKTLQIGIADVELSGPGVSVLRDKTGQFAALGLRTKPPVETRAKPHAAVVPAEKPAASAATFASLPRITIGKFGWKNIRVDLEDQTQVPATRIKLSNIELAASDISTDLSAKKSGHFSASIVAPQVANRLAAQGTVTAPSSDRLAIDGSVVGSGLNTTAFASYLKPLGIEPVLKDGVLTLHATADVQQSNRLTASLSLDHLLLTNGSDESAGIDSLKVSGVNLQAGVLGVDLIEIDKPRVAVRRDADGGFSALGVRIPPPVAASSDAPAVPAPAKPVATVSPIVVSLKKLSVTDAGIHWYDAAIQPPVIVSAGASVELDNLTLGRDAGPAVLNLTAHADGVLDQLLVNGSVMVSPTSPSAKLTVSAKGVRAGPLAAYLPAGVGVSLKDGRFDTTIDAGVSQNPAGGIAARLHVGRLQFQDGADSLFGLESVDVNAPRIDLPTHALDVTQISVTGVQTHAEKLPGGELTCMGLLLGTDSSGPRMAIAPSHVEPRPASVVVSSAPPTTGPSVAELIAASHRVLPSVTVDDLDLNLEKLTLTDLSRPESSPLVVSDLRLHNLARIDWLGKDATSKPPTLLQLGCRISPLVDQVAVNVAVTPFARQPGLKVDFSATGIHGRGLTDLVPELKPQIDGSAMDTGTAAAHLEADAKWDRQSPIDFDVSHGLDLSFLLSKVEYREKPDGPVLAGVDAVMSENIRIVPAESIVHFKTLEIDKPIGLVTQDSAGIHALGWVYKLPTTQPTGQPAVISTTAPASTQTVVVTNLQMPPPPSSVTRAKQTADTGEVRIDKLLIDGLDFRVEDSAVDPPLVIPLNGLDVEVRNISSRSPLEDKPIRFSAIVNADKVKLRKKGATTQAFEDRDLFSQITANGEVSLYPKLHGWAKTSVSGLDLAALQGPARALGEDLRAGVYDSTVDLRFDPTGAIVVNSRFVLTDLSLSEPPNGLIYRTLKLPAPLDVAIGAVQGADGSISLPLSVSVDPQHISYADLGLAAAGGVSQVVVTAIAAAPLKAANDVGGLLGLPGEKKTAENITSTILFAPGSGAIGADQSAQLAPLLQKLHDDPALTVTLRHTLGGGDIRLAGVRANPTPEQSTALEAALRSRKQQLLQERADTAGQARAKLVSLGSIAAEPTLQHLRSIDRELESTEDSLDQIGELLKPGADRLTERRTRSAALQIASDRLSAIQSAILSTGISPDRVKSINARFNPEDNLDGGEIVITAVEKK
jgi:hypothetical protein